ncbi:MAG: hypothetical protein M3325_11010 [Actinomycetota bacterium]|nr:hypothetical protein [Actinomycetota bacterium]
MRPSARLAAVSACREEITTVRNFITEAVQDAGASGPPTEKVAVRPMIAPTLIIAMRQ